jgi:hypothetical protein
MLEIDGVIADEVELMFDILQVVEEVVEVEHDEVEVDEKFYLYDLQLV